MGGDRGVGEVEGQAGGFEGVGRGTCGKGGGREMDDGMDGHEAHTMHARELACPISDGREQEAASQPAYGAK